MAADTMITIIHNPKCSKSRKALELIQEQGIEPEVVDYLNGALTKPFLEMVFAALNMRPKEVLRVKEEEFKALSLDLENDSEVIDAILSHPIILERPIVIKEKAAVIGRPPENVLELLN